MAQRVIALVVVLTEDITNEDAEDVMGLLSLVRNVSSVKPVGKDIMTEIARDRARQEIKDKLRDVLGPGTR